MKEELVRTSSVSDETIEPSSTPSEELQAEDNDEEKLKGAIKFFGQILSLSTQQTVKALNQKSKLDNVAIFVDYDNVYWTLMNRYSHDPDNIDPEKNLFVKLWKKYGLDNVRTFRAYADFEKIRTDLTSLQKKRIQIRHVYSNGKDGDNRKNSSDIELCIDAIEHTYKDPNITCYVFVTADSDMIPIISRMMYKNKRVELYYLSDAAPKHVDITSFVHSSEDLLSFLNVEVKEYDINEYIARALTFIYDWYIQYDNSNYYLGAPWLKEQFVKKFGLTADAASKLLEKLKIDELTYDDKKHLSSGEVKTSIKLTEKGMATIQEYIEKAAAAKETS